MVMEMKIHGDFDRNRAGKTQSYTEKVLHMRSRKLSTIDQL